MDRKLIIETVAMLLFFAAFAVISVGTTNGIPAMWWIGFAAFVLAGLLPVATRFMNHLADKPRDVGMEFDDRTS